MEDMDVHVHDEEVESPMNFPTALKLNTIFPPPRWRRGFRPEPQKGRRAFAILENAIAAAILALVVVGILTITSHSFVMMQQTRDFSRANQILQQKMEDIRLLRFSDIQSLPSTFTDRTTPKTNSREPLPRQLTAPVFRERRFPSKSRCRSHGWVATANNGIRP